MSILIKGMQMPKNCNQCFYKRSGCPCNKHNQGRPSDCPLVEIKPHGRLIDADELYDSMMMAMVMTGYQSRALSEIDYAPTIIEAEVKT